MAMLEQYFPLLTLAVALVALVFVALTAKKVFGFSEGNDRMAKLSASIRSGANAFLKRQYTVVAIIFVVVALILGVMAITGNLSPFVPFAFLTGGIYSALAGFVGMKIATSSNARTANACQSSLNKGLKVAFSAGSVMGFTVVALGLFDISVWFVLLKFVFKLGIDDITNAMVMFGMGASFMALFARVGGGIFTKAADVGADLVGKVEAGIPEDDPRNPAVIADNVGDNVGDCAGMAADLFETYVVTTVAVMLIGNLAFGESSIDMSLGFQLVIGAASIIASIIGTVFVKMSPGGTIMGALYKGLWIAAGIAVVAFLPITFWMLGDVTVANPVLAPEGITPLSVWICAVIGVALTAAMVYITDYYTSSTKKPVDSIA